MHIGKKKILSLDLGSTKIRICDLQKGAHKLQMSYYDELECPVEVEDKESFIMTEGKSFIKKQPGNTFYASLPGRGVLIRTLTIPKVPLKKIHDILKYEVQQQIPFPLEMVEWKYQILSETNQNFNILLAAAKKELINEFLSRISSLGVDYLYLDTDLFACFNSFVFSKFFKTEKCQAVLELGANSSNLTIHHQEKILMRSLTTAGDTITSAIAEAESISFAEAEDKKIKQGLQLPIVATYIENLNTEIQNSIDYWRFTQKGPEVEDFYLCGRSASFDNFKEFFQEKSRISTHYFDVLSSIELNSQYSSLQNRSIEFAVLAGIALRKNKQTFVNLDMLPAEIERMKEFRQNRPYIYLSAIMAGLIAVTPTLFFNQDKAMLKGLLSEINVSLKQYERYKPEVDELNSEISALKGKEGIIKEVTGSKTVWLKKILAIGDSLPSSRIYISSFAPGEESFTPGIVSATGEEIPEDDGERYEGMTRDEYWEVYGEYPEDTEARLAAEQAPRTPPGVAPGRTEAEQAPPGREINITEEKVFTLNGQVIVTDIRNAFSDFKTFVSAASGLDFVERVNINYCEIDSRGENLEFSLVLHLK